MSWSSFIALWFVLTCLLEPSSGSNEECSTEDGCVVEEEKPAIFHHAPGFRAAITNMGLNYLNGLLVPKLKEELMKLDIPEISGKADIKVGDVKYKFKRIHLTEVEIGSSSLESSSETGLTLKMADISLAAKGDWSYKLLWSDDGSVRMAAKGVSLVVGILIDASGNGQPALLSTSCQFRVGDITVKFNGGASWLLNLFKRFVESKIKDLLNSKICDLVSSNIRKPLDKALASFPVTVPIDKVAKLSYALMKKPSFTPSMIVTDHKGEFFAESQNSADIPFSPSPLPSLPAFEGRMMYLWVTDYVVNSAALVYMRAGYLQFNVTPDMIGDSGSFFKLDTNSFSHIIPQLHNAHPGKPLILGVRSTNIPPRIVVTPQEAVLSVPGAVDFYVIGDEDHAILTFTLGVMVSLEIQVWTESRDSDHQLFLKANVTYLDADVNILTSSIGDIGNKSVTNVWNTISVICQMFLMPPINRFTNKGLPIPTVKGMTFVDPKLLLGEGYVLIETDISQR